MYRYGDAGLERWLDRSPVFDASKVSAVAQILDEVRREGLEAVLRSARRYDAPELASLFVSDDEFLVELPGEEDEAIRFAIERVRDFHETQAGVVLTDWEDLGDGTYGWRTDVTDTDDTGFEGQRLIPLRRVGVYVPGGMASYPSSVVMNVVPALAAGVEEIVVTTPARADGTVSPAVLVACRHLGVRTVLKCGGAAAVAAMAFGFEGFERVDKIVGPGNSYVTEAKRQVWGSVGLDMYAGPSEVAVYVDEEGYAEYAAADLLTQVEHAPDNVGMLIAPTAELIEAVLGIAEAMVSGADREETLREALRSNGVGVVASFDEAVEVINRFAPEHLSIVSDEAPAMAGQIRNCGCVLIGPYSPQSCGDFVSGPSHTLPTSGAARFASPVNVLDFFKVQSVSMLSASDVDSLNGAVQVFGRMEGFPIHAKGSAVRLDSE